MGKYSVVDIKKYGVKYKEPENIQVYIYVLGFGRNKDDPEVYDRVAIVSAMGTPETIPQMELEMSFLGSIIIKESLIDFLNKLKEYTEAMETMNEQGEPNEN